MTESTLTPEWYRLAFERSTPCYFLDVNYHLVGWNQLFEMIFAKPLKLEIGQHVSEFVSKWQDHEAVFERAAKIFGVGEPPLVDIEPMAIQTEAYGLVKMVKIATQIRAEDTANHEAWVVDYLIQSAEESQKLWTDIEKLLNNKI